MLSDPQTLVARVLRRALGDAVSALTGAIARGIPSPQQHARHKTGLVFGGPPDEGEQLWRVCGVCVCVCVCG